MICKNDKCYMCKWRYVQGEHCEACCRNYDDNFEEEEKEVHVGDEVECDGVRGVLVREPYKIGGDEKTTLCLIWYGTHMSSTDIHKVKPTGRHFAEVDQLIQALKEGEMNDC